MDGHIGIAMPLEEDTSFASLPSSGSTYGLVPDDQTRHRHPHRARVVEKYTARCKMLGALFVAVLVIGGSAMFIGANHQSTEVIAAPLALETKPEEVSSSQGIPTNVFLLKQPVVATPSGRQEVAHKHADDISGPVRVESKTGIVTDKLNNATGSTGSAMHDHPSAASVNDSKVVTTPKDEPDESKLQSEEPDVVYNPLANCTNPVKHPPKTEGDDVKKQFIPLENNPVGLLLAMRECPTFTYYECKSHASNKKAEVVFKAVAHIRSNTQRYIGYATKKKDARKDAAYRAALKLYPEVRNSALPESEIGSRIHTFHCTEL